MFVTLSLPFWRAVKLHFLRFWLVSMIQNLVFLIFLERSYFEIHLTHLKWRKKKGKKKKLSLSSNAGACRWCRSLELLKSSCTQDCSCPSSVSLELFESSFSRLLCLGCCVISREGGIEKRETCTFRIYCTRTVLVMAIFWWAGEGYYLTKQLEEQRRWRQLRPQRSKISKEDHLFCK